MKISTHTPISRYPLSTPCIQICRIMMILCLGRIISTASGQVGIKCSSYLAEVAEHIAFRGEHNTTSNLSTKSKEVAILLKKKDQEIKRNADLEIEPSISEKLRDLKLEGIVTPTFVNFTDIDWSKCEKKPPFKKINNTTYVKVEPYIKKTLLDFLNSDIQRLKRYSVSDANTIVTGLCKDIIGLIENLHDAGIYHNDLHAGQIHLKIYHHTKTKNISRIKPFIRDFSVACTYNMSCKIEGNGRDLNGNTKEIDTAIKNDRDMYYLNRRILDILTTYLQDVIFDNGTVSEDTKIRLYNKMDPWVKNATSQRFSFEELRNATDILNGEEKSSIKNNEL